MAASNPAAPSSPPKPLGATGPERSFAVSVNIGGGVSSRAVNHRGTVVAARRRDKKRIPTLCVFAIARMRVLMKPRLDLRERTALYVLYMQAGAMRHVQRVHEVLSHAGIGGGLEEMEAFLTERAWFKPGSVVSWQQFLMLTKYLKSRFVEAQEVSDSDVAFIALGGNDDLTGTVSAEVLKDVCEKFDLGVDVDEFVRLHDDDNSGKLEIEEFSALFDDDDDDGDEASGAADKAAHHGAAGQGKHRHVEDHADGLNPRHAADAADENGVVSKAGKREEAAEKHVELTPQQVIADVDQFIKEQQNNDRQQILRRRSTVTTTKADSQRGGKRGTSPERKPLWEPTKPADAPAKERLAQRTNHVHPGSTFSTSRRFEFVSSVAAQPTSPTDDADGTAGGSGSSRTKLPPVSARAAPKQPAWAENTPFGAGAGSTSGGGARTARKSHDTYERQKLPIIARNNRGQTMLVQPEMTF